MQDILRSLFMKAARKPAAAAAVLVAALAGSMGVGMLLGSCQMLGKGTRETTPIARQGDASPAADIHRVAGIKGEPDIRIRVIAGAPSATFERSEGFWVGTLGDPKGSELLRSPVRVTLGETQWVVRDGSNTERMWARGRDLDVMPAGVKPGESGAGVWATVNGVKYAGMFRLVAPEEAVTARASTGGGSGRGASGRGVSGVLGAMQPVAGESAPAAAAPAGFDVIEHVPLEEYLPGVLAKEMPNSWSLGAFKVQAVAARSYAIHQKQRAVAAGKKFDVEATTQDQAYIGATGLPVAVEATTQTRGQVLEFGGAVLRAYYSSTCGGRTASAKDTWPTGRGYEYNLAAPIQGHERASACEASSLFRWKVERPKAELVKRIATYGEKNGFLIRQIKDLAKIEVLRVNETGRPAEYKVIEPGGKWYPMKGEDLRLACNTDYDGPPSSPPITRQTRVNSSDLEFEVKGSVVTISGRGFGHGVGMCQYCAQAMGKAGEDPVVLLERFYPGARVVKAY